MTGPSAGQELLDVCDPEDHVVGTATRSEIHRERLLHRAVHIWVFHPDGRLLIHRRSAAKDEFPLAYTSSASGHVDAGECYEIAAARELQEELGLEASLSLVVKLPAAAETAWEHTQLYRCTTHETPRPDANEIDHIEWVTLEELAARIREGLQEFTPPFRELFRWYETHCLPPDRNT